MGDVFNQHNIRIVSKEELIDKCLDEIKGMVASLKPGQAIAIRRDNSGDVPWKPVFTIFTEGTVKLGKSEPES